MFRATPEKKGQREMYEQDEPGILQFLITYVSVKLLVLKIEEKRKCHWEKSLGSYAKKREKIW